MEKLLNLFNQNKKFILFLCVGLLNTLFGYSIFAFFLWIGVHFTISALISTIAGILFNFTTFPIKDPTNSFRLFSTELVNKVKIESDKGFTLSLELAAKAHRLGYKFIEIPSTWIERDTGKSRFKLLTFLLPYTKWLFYIIKTSIFYRNAK